MAFVVVDPEDFTTDGILLQDAFLEKADQYDWSKFQGKKVLVRGCSSTIIPPWVYMYITSRLCGVAKSVRFGNEHDNIVIHRATESGE